LIINDNDLVIYCSVVNNIIQLIVDKRDSTITDRLRHAKTFTSFPFRTEKFRKSFIPYCLNLYD